MAEWIHRKIKGSDLELITCSNCGCSAPLYSYIKEGEIVEKIQHVETEYCPNCGEKMNINHKNLDYKKMWEDIKLVLSNRMVHDTITDGFVHNIICSEDKSILELMKSYELLDEYEIKQENNNEG